MIPLCHAPGLQANPGPAWAPTAGRVLGTGWATFVNGPPRGNIGALHHWNRVPLKGLL